MLSVPLRVPPAADLAHTLAEARAIADGVGQTTSTAHLLLALFTVPNPAEVLLRERGIDDDGLLGGLDSNQREATIAIRAVLDETEQNALRTDARQANTLHLLVALMKVREGLAHRMLEEALATQPGGIGAFRNRVLSFVTGVMPRRLLQPLQDARGLAPPAAPTPRAPRGMRQKPGDDWVVPKGTLLDGTGGTAEDVAPPANPPPPPRKAPKDAGTLDALLSAALGTGSALDKAQSHVSVVDEAPAPRPVAKASKREPALSQPPTMPPTAFDLDPDRFPWLTSLGRNLTAWAANERLDPSVGRAAELEQLIDVLGKRRANNPVLVGDPGVGKTAIVEGLAVKIVRRAGDVAPLAGKVLIELDMGRIVAGTSLRGSFSERMQGLKRDVQRAKGQVIVFIDELHTLMGAGSSGDGPQDAAGELKTALARGDFPCIGSTTQDEFRKYIEQDPALERRFVKIVVDEPDDATAIAIVRGAKPLYEEHHGVKADDDAVAAAVQLASRFLHEKRQPAKSLDLLDLALSRGRRAGKTKIVREDVARVCADVAKVPVDRVLLEDKARFLQLESFLAQKVIGHEDNITRIAHAIRRAYAGFSTHRPVGSFLFLGPSGVGKTETAKALADFLFGTDKALVRLDMSEFSEPHTVARLVGAPPGYVGHGDGGQLTEALRRRPHAVVLFDEIEKAHPDVLPILLQIIDDGRLTDSRGRTVTFRHAVVILTSNLGAAQALHKPKAMGFGASAPSPSDKAAQREELVLEAARKHFAPELWGRIEDKLVFAALGKAELSKIAALLLTASSRALETTRSITLRFDDDVLGWLVDNAGVDASSGARPMRQAIQRLVEAPVSEAILRGEVQDGARIRLQVKDGQLVARAARPDRAAAPPR